MIVQCNAVRAAQQCKPTRVQAAMTSTEARGASATREFALALASGGLYGATNTVVGHPFDTVKTKMQTQSGFTNSGALASAANPVERGCSWFL